MILNIIGILDASIAHMFRKFEPVKRMIISRDNSMLNDYFSITKDQLIDLNFFCTMGKMDNDTEETFPVKDSSGVVKYVPLSQVKRFKSGELDVTSDEVMEKMITG